MDLGKNKIMLFILVMTMKFFFEKKFSHGN